MQLYVFSRSCEIKVIIRKRCFREKGIPGLKNLVAYCQIVYVVITQIYQLDHNSTYSAASSISAGAVRTLINLNLTARPSETRPAGAGVAALTSVSASSSILAWFVVRAVIKI